MTWVARARGAATRHPLLLVSVVGVVFAIGHLVWIADQRPPGTLNTDEAGYIAHAMRIERASGDVAEWGGSRRGQLANPFVVMVGTTGPLVPAISAPLMAVGERTPWWAMAVQPFLHVVAAVGVAGIVRRVSRSPGLQPAVAGVVALGLPVVVLSSRSYQLASGAAAALSLAVWALVASDGGRRRWAMVAAGAAVGALVLSRTMAVVYLPGFALAGLLLIDRTRHSLVNAALGAGTALVVAGPWWVASWGEVTKYLVRYGYGDLAQQYGQGGAGGRVAARLDALWQDVRLLLLIPAILVVVAAVVVGLRRARDVGVRPLLGTHRALLSVAVVVAVGLLMLMSSQNEGVWFELPLVVLAVAVVVPLSRAVPSGWRPTLGAAVVVVSILNVGAIGLLGTQSHRPGHVGFASSQFADMYQRRALLETTDPQLLITRSDRQAVGADWWGAHAEAAAAIAELRQESQSLHLTISGSSALINYNSLLLAQEVGYGSSPGGDTPDTTADDLSASVEPWQGDSARVLVLISTSLSQPFPVDAEVSRLAARAADSGWEVYETVRLPDDGEVVVMVHPDSIGVTPPS